jgi:DNA replication protein DnaC
MADLSTQFKALRLYGMAQGYADLEQNGTALHRQLAESILRPLLEAEMTDRGLRSVRYQMNAARFPMHRDLAGFQFEHSRLDRRQIETFATLAFTEKAENLVFIGGTGTGKTHLATADCQPPDHGLPSNLTSFGNSADHRRQPTDRSGGTAALRSGDLAGCPPLRRNSY